jgi:hypothetical protein
MIKGRMNSLYDLQCFSLTKIMCSVWNMVEKKISYNVQIERRVRRFKHKIMLCLQSFFSHGRGHNLPKFESEWTSLRHNCFIHWISIYHLLVTIKVFWKKFPVEARFCVPVLASSLDYLASCTIGAIFPGVKRPGCDADVQTPSTAEFANRMGT